MEQASPPFSPLLGLCQQKLRTLALWGYCGFSLEWWCAMNICHFVLNIRLQEIKLFSLFLMLCKMAVSVYLHIREFLRVTCTPAWGLRFHYIIADCGKFEVWPLLLYKSWIWKPPIIFNDLLVMGGRMFKGVWSQYCLTAFSKGCLTLYFLIFTPKWFYYYIKVWK